MMLNISRLLLLLLTIRRSHSKEASELRSIRSLVEMHSNCSAAIDIDTYNRFYRETMYRSRGKSSLIPQKFSKDLKLINAGSGTTGTGGLKGILCNELKLKAVHHMDRCERGPRLSGHINPLVAWKSALLWCVTITFTKKL